MKKIAWVFPGQGAQYVGMGKDLYEQSETARKLFDKANEVLGFDIAKLCFEGPENQLKSTENSQPAIFLVSYICLQLLKETAGDRIVPSFVAGLSLGEYTALASAGVFSFEEGLQLVRKRGLYMEDAAKQNPGQMLSLIGVTEEVAKEIADAASVEMANFNCPGQIVFSGKNDAIAQAKSIAEEKGVKRSIILDVSGPFHSSLMDPASKGLQSELDAITLTTPDIPVVTNVNAQLQSDPAIIKENLVNQVSHATYWAKLMNYFVEQGVECLYEIGPGKVLKGLQRRINKEIEVVNVGTLEELQALTNCNV